MRRTFVAQLPYVARPVINHQQVHGLFGEFLISDLSRFLLIKIQIVIDRGRYLFSALPELRHLYPDDIQTVKEVFAEPAFGDGSLQLRVRRGDDAHVYFQRLGFADG